MKQQLIQKFKNKAAIIGIFGLGYFDYSMFLKNAKLIIDTRGVYLEPLPNVVKA